MRTADLALFNWKVIRRHGFRTLMLLIAMSIGVMAVNLLTGLGEGARGFILNEFSVLGKDVLIMMPGRRETTGGMPPVMGTSPRDLTLADAAALRRIPGVERVAPLIVGSIELSTGGRLRETVILGTNADFFPILKVQVRQGQILPEAADDQATAVCLLGSKIKQDLFGNRPALGQWLRAGDRRFRVVGIIESQGRTLSMNMDEALVIPVASAQALFNQEGLFRLFIETKASASLDTTRRRILQRIQELHEGVEDVTIISQDSIMASFEQIIRTMTLAVSGIGAISLLVAGVLIMNVTLVSVSQRTSEIGLLKALGASASQVRRIFLTEACGLALVGALAGLLLSEVAMWLVRSLYPSIPFGTPWWAKAASISVALATALLFALMPAGRAARMEPVTALQSGHGV